jgi:hypothetical protein
MDKKIVQKSLYLALLIALVVRVVIFTIAIISPIKDSNGSLVSPLLEQVSLDTTFYQESRQQYAKLDFNKSAQELIKFYENPTEKHGYILALPVFPLVLYFFNYTKGNTFLLAFIYLCMSIVLSWLWLYWLNKQQLPKYALWVFAILPNPLWFMLAVSTDLLFALIFTIFFILYFKKPIKQEFPLWVIPLFIMLLTRPNGISIVLFVLWDKIYNRQHYPYEKIINISVWIVSVLVSIFLLPYLWVFLSVSYNFPFFNVPSKEYITGLFPFLPTGINQLASWLCFAGAKVLYFVGLRPSYGNISFVMLLIRAFLGIILLPGIAYLFLKGDRRHKVLFLLYFLPIFLGASQDRYNLPVQPILYYYSVLAIIDLRSKLKSRKN